MKQQKIKHAILFCLLVAIWGTLAASLFRQLNVYEYEEVKSFTVPKYRTQYRFRTGNRRNRHKWAAIIQSLPL